MFWKKPVNGLVSSVSKAYKNWESYPLHSNTHA